MKFTKTTSMLAWVATSSLCTLFMIVVMPTTLFAQAPGGVSFSSGTPEFNFQIPISGLRSLTLCERGGGDTLSCPGIAKYIQVAYTFLVGFAAVLAVLAMTWGGVQWLISRGESGKIQEARKVIGNAVVGLLIALGSYAVLSVINPDLVQFQPLKIKRIKEIRLTMNADPGGRAPEFRNIKTTPSSSGPAPTSAADFPAIKWLDLRKNWSVGNEYGEEYADILDHAAISEAEWYRKGGTQEGTHPNRILDAHEYDHMTGGNYGNGKTVRLKLPVKTKNSAIASAVPKSLRSGGLEYSCGTIYKCYIQYMSDADTPGVAGNIFAELTARNSASRAGLEMHNKGLMDKVYYDPPEKASLSEFASPMENTSFIVFALAMALAVEKTDPDYFSREPQFKDTIKFLIQEGRRLNKELEKIYGLVEVDVLKGLQKNADAQSLRDLAKRWYTGAWTQQWLGF